MATFWERATGFGDGASEMLDLQVLQSALLLWLQGRITTATFQAWLGLTEPQQAEAQHLFFQHAPSGDPTKAAPYCVELRAVLEGARAGLPELDSISNVFTALNYTPPDPE